MNDLPMGQYDVTVIITGFEPDAASGVRVNVPVIPEAGLRATLGILARTVEQPHSP